MSLPMYEVPSEGFVLCLSFVSQYRGRVINAASHSGAIRQVLDKFSKLLPPPRRNAISAGNRHRSYASSGIDASLARHVSHPLAPSLLVVARDARGNLLLRTASAKREVYEAM